MRDNFARYVKMVPYRDYGPCLSPFSAMMIMNDLRTLRSKMDQFSRNTMQVARFLNEHVQVEDVFYPGLESMPGHSLAAEQLLLVDCALEDGSTLNRYGHLMGFKTVLPRHILPSTGFSSSGAPPI